MNVYRFSIFTNKPITSSAKLAQAGMLTDIEGSNKLLDALKLPALTADQRSEVLEDHFLLTDYRLSEKGIADCWKLLEATEGFIKQAGYDCFEYSEGHNFEYADLQILLGLNKHD